ncbi:MAG: TolC family protein [Rubellimicrobium sp.]|nr:TolC family protein [Rubellimicrobium sp.]
MAIVGLSACSGVGGGEISSRSDNAFSVVDRGTQPSALDATMREGRGSPAIDALLNRRSVLASGPMRDVADSVMAANTRAAEADLRAARLRAEAQASNWLPALGPSITLDAMGALVAGLMVSQAIFDNGQRAAERAYARADIEVAAVALADDSNKRVLEALELYLNAEAARSRAAVSAAGMQQMGHFAHVMTERVNAGISDRADLQIVLQRQDQMRSDMASDQEAAASAMRELQAMAARPVEGITGLSPIAAPSPTATPLRVMRAQAESERAVAEATARRAGFLPGLTVGGNLADGVDGLGVTLAAPNGIGLGTGAALEALRTEEAAAAARIGQEREAADRAIAAMEGQLVSLRRQEAEARQLAADAARNYALFAEQQRAGQRSVPETVGVFETRIRAERAASDLRYSIARLELRIAAMMGTLVDGERI